MYIRLTNPLLDLRPGRRIYVMPRVRHISAAVAPYHKRMYIEAVFGSAIPEQRGVSMALPFTRCDGGLHDG